MDYVDDHQAVEPQSYSKRKVPPQRTYSFGKEPVVSVGTWIGLMLILGLIQIIPFIGSIIAFVVLLILAFGDFNQNIKNWARAILIIIAIVFLIALFIGGLGFLFNYRAF